MVPSIPLVILKFCVTKNLFKYFRRRCNQELINEYKEISTAKKADKTFSLNCNDGVLMKTSFACLVYFLFKALLWRCNFLWLSV